MDDRWFTDYTPSQRWPHYTRANAGEVLSTPASPLGQKFTWDNGIIHGAAHGSTRTGLYEADEYDPVIPETFGFFGGYLFINLSNIRMQGVRNPALTVEQLDQAFFGDHPDVPPYTPHRDDEKPHLLPKIETHLGFVMSTTEWPDLDADRADVDQLREERPNLTNLTDRELLDRARMTQPMLVHGFSQHYVASSSAGIAPGILIAIGEAIGDPTIPMRLMAGLGDVDSAAPSYELWDMSRVVRQSPVLTKAFDEGVEGLVGRLEASHSTEAAAFLAGWNMFIHEYGSRGPNEWEISADTWETDPNIALAALDRIRFQNDDASPRQRVAKLATEREELTGAVRAQLSEIGDEELAGMFEGALVGGNMMVFRERAKTTIVKAVHEGRMVFRELGRRHAAAGDLADSRDIFMLTDDELESFVADPASFSNILAERSNDYRKLFDLIPPFIIRDAKVPPLPEWEERATSTTESASSGDVLPGVPGSPGTITGRARIVMDPADPPDLQPGDIMVAPLTDPAWTPLFMAVDGVVVNVGGQISHAIIVSRELGLPCVVSVSNATDLIPDGTQIEVDGNTGQVTVL
ncbi:MAG: PEP-utilizing enzyme [Actinomycetota bacterium]|nr:PEP-utilizing enzyme [Actinomycetota bacterium]